MQTLILSCNTGAGHICGIQQSKLCCQLSKIVYWLARSDFIRPFAGLCSECTRARTGKEASTKAD